MSRCYPKGSIEAFLAEHMGDTLPAGTLIVMDRISELTIAGQVLGQTFGEVFGRSMGNISAGSMVMAEGNERIFAAALGKKNQGPGK